MSWLMSFFLFIYIVSIIMILKNKIINISLLMSDNSTKEIIIDVLTIICFPFIVYEFYMERIFNNYNEMDSRTVWETRLTKVLAFQAIILYPFYYLRNYNTKIDDLL